MKRKVLRAWAYFWGVVAGAAFVASFVLFPLLAEGGWVWDAMWVFGALVVSVGVAVHVGFDD